MKVSTNWLKDFITLAPPVERILEHLTMAGLEVKKTEPVQIQKEKDLVFEVEVTSNRPDWLSHLGVAREIAAVENLSLKLPEIDKTANRPAASGWKVELKEVEGCPFYTGIYIEGIQPVATPDFMKARLEACGIRSINFLVDVTNYVLFETGQPLHAFDADLLEGKEIRIRRAKAGETFTAINGKELKLQADDLVIADARQATALAGVMGGKNTEISDRTRNIFLESAYFHPRWVRKTSKRYGLASDSSYRFERKVDPEGVDFARERAVALIRQYAKPRFISAVLKAGDKPLAVRDSTLHFNLSEIKKRLGAPVKSHEAFSILTRLGLQVKKDSEESWKVSVPSFRSDISQPIDLVEEIARIYGYDKIPETLPAKAPVMAPRHPVMELEEKARDFFAGAGFFETVTFSLISPAQIHPEEAAQGVKIDNPRNAELTLMRPRFYPSLLGVVQKNIRQGASGGAFYEIANLYRSANKQTEETKTIGLVLFGKWKEKNWLEAERKASFYDLKGAITAFLSSLGLESVSFSSDESCGFLVRPGSEKITAGNAALGFVGELSSEIPQAGEIEEHVYYAEISLPAAAKVISSGPKKFHELPKYPAIARDLAIIVPDSTKAGMIQEEIRKLGKGLIVRVELFDLFTGGRVPKGAKNLAFRVIYQSHEKTLLADEIQKLHTEIADSLVKQFQATFQ